MAHCVNHKHPDVQNLAKLLNINPVNMATKIAIWQEQNNTYNFPTIDDIQGYNNRQSMEKEFKNKVNRDYHNISEENVTQNYETFNKSTGSAANENNQYINELDTPNKRYIAVKFFDSKFPFKSSKAKEVADLINSEFDLPVLTASGDTLTFTNNINNAKSVNTTLGLDINDNTVVPVNDTTNYGDIDDIINDNDEAFNDENIQGFKRQPINDEATNDIIERKKQIVRLLKRRLTEKSGRYSEISSRIDRLNSQISNMEESLKKKTLKKVKENNIKQAELDAVEIDTRFKSIEANSNKDLNEDQLNDNITELRELSAYIQGWMDINELMDTIHSDDKEYIDKINALQGKYGDLHIKYVELLRDNMSKYLSKVSYKKFSQEDLFNALEDESWIGSQVLGASSSNTDLIKAANDLVQKSAFAINSESIDDEEELNGWIKKLKKATGLSSLTAISEKFLQYDNKGNWTGGLISKISQSYFDKKQELAEEAKANMKAYRDSTDPNKVNPWVKYFNWVKKNTYELKESEYLRWKKTGKIPARKNSDGSPLFTKENLEYQSKLLKKYYEFKDGYATSLLATGRFGEYEITDGKIKFKSSLAEREYRKEMSNWEVENYPFSKYYKKGRRFKINSVIDSKWNDPKFKDIESNPELYEFYKFFRNKTRENDKILPYYNKKQSNYLLNIRKSPAEDFSENKGFRKGLSLLRDGILRLAMEESHSDIETRVNVNGKIYKNIPIGILHNKVDLKDRSKNIFDILDRHTKLAKAYKYKSEIEPILTSMQDIIDDAEEKIPAKASKDPFFKRNKIKNEGALYNSKAKLAYLIDSKLYGESKAEEYKGKNEKLLGNGEKVVFSSSKLVDSLIKWTYLKALSIPNIVSPIGNATMGFLNNIIYTSGGKNVSTKYLMRAYLKMLPNVSKRVGDKIDPKLNQKIVTFLTRLNVLDDINMAAYRDTKQWDKALTILQSKGEYLNQGVLAIAYLMENKVKDKNGNKISLFDAFKTDSGNLVWDTEKMGEQSKVDETDLFAKDKRGVNLYRLSRKIKGINHYLQGDYESALLAKKTSLGRAIMLFKTWIPQTVMQRFGKERYDPDLQENVKGMYRSLVSAENAAGIELSFKQIVPLFLKGMVYKKSLNRLSDIDKENLMRLTTEFKSLIGMVGLVLILGAAKANDDDDDQTKFTYNFLINIVNKNASDLSFYFNPSSLANTIDNGLPIIKTLSDFMNIVPAISKTLSGDPTYDSGPWKDYSRIGVAMSRNIPIINGGVKMYNYAFNEYSFN